MSLLWLDGFETFEDTGGNDGAITALTSGSYLEARFCKTDEAGDPAHGVKRLTLSDVNEEAFLTKYVVDTRSVTIGFNFARGWTLDFNYRFVRFIHNDGDGTQTVQCDLRTMANGGLEFRNGDDTILQQSTGTPLLIDGTWQYVEVYAKIGDTDGEFIVRVDGDEYLHMTGVDTQNLGGTNTMNNVQLYMESTGILNTDAGIEEFDDYYICDNTGPVNNWFLGANFAVFGVIPEANGDSTEWDPVGANSNYLCIDEQVPDNDTTYNETDVINDKDLFTIPNVPRRPAQIFGILLQVWARKEEAGEQKLQLRVKFGGSEITSSPFSLGTNYSSRQAIFETRPGVSGYWQPTDSNSTQIGYSLSA